MDVDKSNVFDAHRKRHERAHLGRTLTVPQLNSTGTITNTTRVIQSIPDSTRASCSRRRSRPRPVQKVAAGATVSQDCSTANPTPYAEWPDPNVAVAKVNFTAGGLDEAAVYAFAGRGAP